MIKKPELTEGQKEKFEKEFKIIVDQLPIDIRKTWDGQFYWNNLTEIPITGDIVNKLKGRLADRYTILINKLKGRTL